MAKQYNRVMLGRGGQFAEECRKDGYIGTGFNIAEDLTPYQSDDYKKFIKQCTPLLMAGEPDITLTAARLGCGMLWTVCFGLKKGDIVLSPINKKEYIVGEISGDYYYVPNTELLHRRPVKWYDTVLKRKDMSSKLQSSARSAGTCSDLTQYAEELESLLQQGTSAVQADFTWIPFYKELAQKLLPYRHNMQGLLEFIYSLKDNKGKLLTDYIHDSKGNRVPTIDPMSVIAIFNRNISMANRKKICAAFKDFLHLENEVPTDFAGIPTLNPMRSFFFDWDTWYYVEPLWDLFEKVATGQPWTNALDNVIKPGSPIGMLSMAMFWIDADNYMPLDGRDRRYLKKYGIATSNMMTASEYADLLVQIKQSIENGRIPCGSFADISLKAYQDQDSAETPEVKVDNKKTVTSVPSDVKNYWWLTGSPKYWSPSKDWELGEDIDYTLFNERGNKRRIFKHFYEAEPGDPVIAYESTPVLQIVAIGRVVAKTDGEVLYIKKIEELATPIPYSEILNNDILQTSEPAQNRSQGSLFRLTEEEFQEVMRLIRKENPEPIIEDEEVEEIEEIKPYTDQKFLQEVFMDADKLQTLKSLLLRKKNLILQGAPGVGKTYAAQRLAYTMMGLEAVDRVKVIQFHQNYSYEDFMMGYKPNNEGFSLVNGAFYDFCKTAKANRDETYFLIIDEINRGNMSKIFGELLQLIEADYRDKPIQLAYTKQMFSVPDNLYIIGMMNTADRSLAMIDYALRRRFCFYKMTPAFASDGFRKYQKSLNSPLLDKVIEQIKQLNKVIEEDASLGEGFAIGHSYFCQLHKADNLDQAIRDIVQYDIIPMLEEYWFDDKKKFEEQQRLLLDAIK